MAKCKPEGADKLYLFGIEVDPCRYEELERHENVTVTILRCKRCGSLDIQWKKTPETVSYYFDKENEDAEPEEEL